jgi:beta-xylosidase
MKPNLSLIAAILILPMSILTAAVTKTPASSSTFTNPIIGGDYADPSVVRVGDEFYMTHSSFRYYPGLLIWKSRDLVHWTPVTRALKKYYGDIWAPDIVHHQGKFFIYSHSTTLGNFVISAPSIEGPWSDPVKLDVKEIDPGHVVGPDGKRYLHYSHGTVVGLSDDGLSVTGKPQTVYQGWPFPKEWRTEGYLCLESPKLFFKDGYYHLISAQGGTAGASSSHMVVEARSRTPLGPWENSPYNPVIRTEKRDETWWSRGHGTVFEAAPGDWWIVYHAYRNGARSLGRQTLMEPVEWTADGWLKSKAGQDPAGPIKVTKLASAPMKPMPKSDDFAGPKLGIQWQFWDEYDPTRFQFRDNSLILKGKGTTPADCSPMTIMTGDLAYEVTVDVEVQGKAQAGLLLFYNPSVYTGMGIGEGALWQGSMGKLRKTRIAVPENKMTLRILFDHNEVEFFAGADEKSLEKFANSEDLEGYNHSTFGGYLSLRPSLYSAGDGNAIFRNFRYRKLETKSGGEAVAVPVGTTSLSRPSTRP